MIYRPVNFVVLRSSGLPIEKIHKFNFSKNLIKEMSKNELNEKIINSIQEEMCLFRHEINKLVKDYRLRDMIRLSTPNYDHFLNKLSSASSLLSQYHRKLLLYLQRGCTKCCTAGTYGPVTIGEFEHSSNNIKLIKSSEERFIMIEDWALDLILESEKIKIKKESFQKIMEDYSLLKKLKREKINHFVELIDKYKEERCTESRDKIYKSIISQFKDITGVTRKKLKEDREKSYESRSIFYELGKRNHSFQIGEKLKEDFDDINKILGIYLALLTKKFLKSIKSNPYLKENGEITRFIFKKFYNFSEEVVNEIIENKTTGYENINYNYKTMPPIFSPDITISSKSIKNLNKGDYSLIIGEIHLSATIVSNPMFEFKRKKLIDNFTSGIKGITNNKIKFQGYDILNDKDFTHHFPLSIQREIIENVNKTSNKKEIIYAYRSNKHYQNKDELFNLLFFPLYVGRKIIFNDIKDDKWGMWARDYIPKILKRIANNLHPKLSKKIKLRSNKEVIPPKINLPKIIKPHFIFNMMKATTDWKIKNNLSNEIFVRYDSYMKPIYINLRNPFLVYEFIKLSKKSKNVDVSDLSPSKERMWFENEEGHYCNEFRYMVFPNIEEQEFKSNKNNSLIIYLPGYKSRFDELIYTKEELVKYGFNVVSLNIDYNRDFEKVAKEIAKLINDKFNKYKRIYLMGLSFGAVMSMKVSRLCKRKVHVFALNPFYERKEVLMINKFKGDYENIKVKDFITKDLPLTLIASIKDKKIPLKNSEKIKKISTKGELFKIDNTNHIFSDKTSQKKIANIINNVTIK